MAEMLCRVRDIDPATGREIILDGPDGPSSLALFRRGERVSAYVNACPHQGRSLSFAPGEFLFGAGGELVCPHHGACFDPFTGACTAGPCKGASLTPADVEVRAGGVYLRRA